MTDHDTTPDDTTDSTARLRDVSHTNPYTGRAFGRTQVYDRGRTVVADGGEREADEAEQLRDVDHTPPKDADSANSVYERGGEGDDEDEADEADADRSV